MIAGDSQIWLNFIVGLNMNDHDVINFKET